LIEKYDKAAGYELFMTTKEMGESIGNQVVVTIATLHIISNQINSCQWQDIISTVPHALAVLRKCVPTNDGNLQSFNFHSTNYVITPADISETVEETIEMAVFPSIIAILIISLSNIEEGIQESIKLLEACHTINGESSQWRRLLEIIEKTLVMPVNHKTLRELVADKEISIITRCIGCLSAGHVGSVREAYQEHLVSISILEKI